MTPPLTPGDAPQDDGTGRKVVFDLLAGDWEPCSGAPAWNKDERPRDTGFSGFLNGR